MAPHGRPIRTFANDPQARKAFYDNGGKKHKWTLEHRSVNMILLSKAYLNVTPESAIDIFNHIFHTGRGELINGPFTAYQIRDDWSNRHKAKRSQMYVKRLDKAPGSFTQAEITAMNDAATAIEEACEDLDLELDLDGLEFDLGPPTDGSPANATASEGRKKAAKKGKAAKHALKVTSRSQRASTTSSDPASEAASSEDESGMDSDSNASTASDNIVVSKRTTNHTGPSAPRPKTRPTRKYLDGKQLPIGWSVPTLEDDNLEYQKERKNRKFEAKLERVQGARTRAAVARAITPSTISASSSASGDFGEEADNDVFTDDDGVVHVSDDEPFEGSEDEQVEDGDSERSGQKHDRQQDMRLRGYGGQELQESQGDEDEEELGFDADDIEDPAEINCADAESSNNDYSDDEDDSECTEARLGQFINEYIQEGNEAGTRSVQEATQPAFYDQATSDFVLDDAAVFNAASLSTTFTPLLRMFHASNIYGDAGQGYILPLPAFAIPSNHAIYQRGGQVVLAHTADRTFSEAIVVCNPAFCILCHESATQDPAEDLQMLPIIHSMSLTEFDEKPFVDPNGLEADVFFDSSTHPNVLSNMPLRRGEQRNVAFQDGYVRTVWVCRGGSCDECLAAGHLGEWDEFLDFDEL